MFNSYGWIQFGMNRKGTDIMDEELQIRYDKKDIELDMQVKLKLKEIKELNEIIRFDFIGGMNNLESFLSVQLSRNHFNSTLRKFYEWVSQISDGSHGILYEIDDEDKNHNPNRPYKVWRLIGTEFEECEETIINEKYEKVNY